MFHNAKDEEECKKLYRRLALYLHPDKGGESDLMILLTESFDLRIEWINLEKQVEEDIKNESKNKKQNKSKHKYCNSYEDVEGGDERLDIMNEIRLYASKRPSYRLDFLYSVNDFLDENGYITSNQYNSLVKAYYSFRMDKKLDKDDETAERMA